MKVYGTTSMSDPSPSAATWPDGSPKTPESIAAEVTGHTYGCNCLACDRAKVPTSAAPRGPDSNDASKGK